jgi:hypothetical protein
MMPAYGVSGRVANIWYNLFDIGDCNNTEDIMCIDSSRSHLNNCNFHGVEENIQMPRRRMAKKKEGSNVPKKT